MEGSPLSPDLPTLQDQEFPDNSLLNDNDSSLWFSFARSRNEDSAYENSLRKQSDISLLNDIDSSPWFSLPRSRNEDSAYENSLRKEHKTLINLNEMFEKVNNNMNQAALNLQQFSNTVEQTDQLLDIWINILSQSIHTQQLISDPSWQGSSAEKQRVLEEQAKERERRD
ncbi:17129_t:CDS:2 [Dentiscutata erythropus]|uniref:DASH complex subunit DUO1 n=1 Tax=Dentiscutata erythropus TaxID=1348616 RepID=A0A9N9DC58_9GLOM|nr:17129_t:CDS:2 [Dentiscutata erythropus]